MKFSLIMATVGRKEEVAVFINSLLLQTYKNHELIIVDQNTDDRVYNIYLAHENKTAVTYIRSAKKGISFNRNIGLANSRGDIIAFPDDDCEYAPDTLEKINFFFENNQNYSFYTCNVMDKTGRLSSIFSGVRKSAEINLKNFMRAHISFTLFVRSAGIGAFRFDEQLGVGAKYGSGEESDLILFLIKNKNRGYYHADTCIYHPNSSRSLETLVSYGKGLGALHRKAMVYYHYYRFLPRFLFLVLKGMIKICFFFKKKEQIASIKGRIFGFFHYPH